MLRTLRPVRALVIAVLAALAATAVSTATACAEPRLTIRGAGSGHGVGMSQYGAQGYALQGADYRAILGHYYHDTRIGRASPSAVVRVLLARGDGARFTGATRAGRARLNPATTYRARLSDGRVTLTGGGRSVKVAQRARIAGPGPLRVGALGRFRGALELSRSSADDRLQVVNAVTVEDYVRGVVAREMWASWHPEALKAQAVAARTYALTIRKGDDGFDHYNDTSSQVYGGVGAETAPTDAAVAVTRGQVVTYGGRAVPTYFFASSGGRTENAEVGFPGSAPAPWLVGVPDPYDHVDNPGYTWTRTFTRREAERLLGDVVDGTLHKIEVTKRGFSGRVVSAEVVSSEGTRTVTGGDLAGAFGLPSTWATYTLRG